MRGKNKIHLIYFVTLLTISQAKGEAGPDNPTNPCYLTKEASYVDSSCVDLGIKTLKFLYSRNKVIENAKLIRFEECFKDNQTVARYTYSGTLIENGHSKAEGILVVDEDQFPPLKCRFGKEFKGSL